MAFFTEAEEKIVREKFNQVLDAKSPAKCIKALEAIPVDDWQKTFLTGENLLAILTLREDSSLFANAMRYLLANHIDLIFPLQVSFNFLLATQGIDFIAQVVKNQFYPLFDSLNGHIYKKSLLLALSPYAYHDSIVQIINQHSGKKLHDLLNAKNKEELSYAIDAVSREEWQDSAYFADSSLLTEIAKWKNREKLENLIELLYQKFGIEARPFILHGLLPVLNDAPYIVELLVKSGTINKKETTQEFINHSATLTTFRLCEFKLVDWNYKTPEKHTFLQFLIRNNRTILLAKNLYYLATHLHNPILVEKIKKQLLSLVKHKNKVLAKRCRDNIVNSLMNMVDLFDQPADAKLALNMIIEWLDHNDILSHTSILKFLILNKKTTFLTKFMYSLATQAHNLPFIDSIKEQLQSLVNHKIKTTADRCRNNILNSLLEMANLFDEPSAAKAAMCKAVDWLDSNKIISLETINSCAQSIAAERVTNHSSSVVTDSAVPLTEMLSDIPTSPVSEKRPSSAVSLSGVKRKREETNTQHESFVAIQISPTLGSHIAKRKPAIFTLFSPSGKSIHETDRETVSSPELSTAVYKT